MRESAVHQNAFVTRCHIYPKPVFIGLDAETTYIAQPFLFPVAARVPRLCSSVVFFISVVRAAVSGGKTPRGRVVDPRELIPRQIRERPAGDLHVVVGLAWQGQRWIDRRLSAGKRHLGAGHVNRLHHRVVARSLDHHIAGALLNRFVERDQQVRIQRHAR